MADQLTETKTYKAIGLMSGTSTDGIDVAYLESDGEGIGHLGGHLTVPYTDQFREKLRALIASDSAPDITKDNAPDSNRNSAQQSVEGELTSLHAAAVTQFMSEENLSPADVDLVGFHGHTTDHDPNRGRTVQIGDGPALSRHLNLPVVNDFRSNDVMHGGQGAPLAPIYHAALFAAVAKPTAVLNIGGVANVTWIGKGEQSLLSFDAGPGNALIDDWVRSHGAGDYDDCGKNAAAGSVDNAALEILLGDPYFTAHPPKSLDRNTFPGDCVQGLSLEDGAATLAMFTVKTIGLAVAHFPAPPDQWIVCGGGRLNHHLMECLARELPGAVAGSDALGWNGDAIEAQAFAYLAIRSILGLPISFPGTTGVAEPLTGGRFNAPANPDR